MTQNDILRRLRHALQINDAKVVSIIALTGADCSRKQVCDWLKQEDVDGYTAISDEMLCRFLDGLIIEKRGLRADGAIPEPLVPLSTNEILKKLRIALNLREEGVLEVFERSILW